MKDKVFILGAGRGQLPLIEICKRRNYETIVFSIDGNYPGFTVADRYYKIDIKDKEKILEIAKKENIIGIMTDQVDAGVSSAAYVAEKMGLPGIGYECSLKFTNKNIMRETSKKLGIKVPDLRVVTSVEEACEALEEIGFPVVIKPGDGYASRGVYKINNRDELLSKFENSMQCSKTKEVIIEQFISGTEYCVEGFAYDYEYVNLAIGRNLYFDIPNLFIPKSSIYKDANSVINDVEKRILADNEKLVKGNRLNFGITHTEYLCDEKSGEIYLVEIAARGGGVFISSDLVPLTCGINVDELLVDYATNQKKVTNLTLKTGTSAYMCFSLPGGTIKKIENVSEVMKIPGVHKIFLDTIKLNQEIYEMKDKSMRFGPILVFADNESNILTTMQHVQDTLLIEVETPAKEIKGIIW